VVGRAEFGKILWILSPPIFGDLLWKFLLGFCGYFLGLVEISITAYSYEF
jgi:hypothetical protein